MIDLRLHQNYSANKVVWRTEASYCFCVQKYTWYIKVLWYCSKNRIHWTLV